MALKRTAVLQAIRRPESAAVAGIVFAIILSYTLALLHTASPETPTEFDDWVTDDAGRSAISLALTLLPFAGIAFLWFIAVVRTHLGARDDRFFETVFLGSGLIFVAALFTSGAALSAVVRLDTTGEPPTPDTVAYAWALASSILGIFGAKMAAVFCFAAATAGVRAGSLPRWLGVLGYLTGLTLLVIPPLPSVFQFLFPLWVLLISLLVLLRRSRLG